MSHGDRQRGDALLAGRFIVGSETVPLDRPRFRRGRRRRRRSPSSCRASPGCATSPPPPRARRAPGSPRRVVGRWLLAHGTTRRRGLGAASVGRAHPLLDRLRALHPVEQRRAAIARPCSTRWRAAPATSTPTPTRRRPGSTGSPPGAAWSPPACSSRAASRASRAAKPGWRARSPSAQFDDGGLVSRSPFEQVLLVDRLGLLRACYLAAKQTMPDGDRGRRRGRARRASWRHHGRRRAVELAGLQSRRSRRG